MAEHAKTMTKSRWAALAAIVLIPLLAWQGPSMLARYYLNEARSNLMSRDLDAALGNLESAQSWTPHDPEISFYMARVYRRQGKLTELSDQLKQARDLGYDIERLKHEQWIAEAQSGQMARATPHLPELLVAAREEDGQEIFEAYVSGYFMTYQFGPAIELLGHWINEYPLDERPHIYFGTFHENGQQWKQAAESYRRAIEVAPKDTDARLKLAKVLLELQQHDEATAEMQKLMGLKPNDPMVKLTWAECMIATGSTDKARSVLDQLVKTDSDNIDVKFQLGQLEAQSGNHEQAVEWFREVTEVKPFERSMRYALATSLRATGKADEAQEHFDFTSRSVKAHSRIQLLLEELRKKTDDTKIRHEVGSLMLDYGDPKEAEAWLRSVLEFDPDHEPTHEALLKYFIKAENNDAADFHRQRLQFIRSRPVIGPAEPKPEPETDEDKE
ncbi:MAG: hypothetical protein CMJ78_05365 [Planctomycetaceae bacterium]|nr:hypothetical protein [Planctomycetaceae bacterium]